MTDREHAADMLASWAFAVAFLRRVHELRAMYGLLPTEAKALAMRETRHG